MVTPELAIKLTDELNKAIEPVLQKYIKIFEDELRKCILEQNV